MQVSYLPMVCFMLSNVVVMYAFSLKGEGKSAKARMRSCEGGGEIVYLAFSMSHFRLNDFTLLPLRSKGESARVKMAQRNTMNISNVYTTCVDKSCLSCTQDILYNIKYVGKICSKENRGNYL